MIPADIDLLIVKMSVSRFQAVIDVALCMGGAVEGFSQDFAEFRQTAVKRGEILLSGSRHERTADFIHIHMIPCGIGHFAQCRHFPCGGIVIGYNVAAQRLILAADKLGPGLAHIRHNSVDRADDVVDHAGEGLSAELLPSLDKAIDSRNRGDCTRNP